MGATPKERNEHRLEAIERDGLLVIGRARTGSLVWRVVGSMLFGLLGLTALVLGADGFVAVCGVVMVICFGIILPIVNIRKHRQDHSLELTPEAFTLVRRVGRTAETVHRVSWSNVVSVGTVRFGNQPEALNIPSVVVLGASGVGRRPLVRTTFRREIRGERVTLNQPLAIGRWELVDLLTEAHRRFDPKPDTR
ncbi:MAG TPA: hypothetical protein K8V08_11300 [Brevibacterium senegalense]|uniref:Uncharacterized protein n=1 Tax=Brevibacterium senegalense TaxID=1033736 RepID=A0A921MFV6_9MICO|nr:hypothetical protein [Brevibacterium senegalense]